MADKNVMPKGLVFLLSILALAVFFGFIIASLFFGFADFEISCNSSVPGKGPTCVIEEQRFFGIFKRKVTAENIQRVDYYTRDIRPGYQAGKGSTIVFVTPSGNIPITRASTNFGSWKKEVLTKMRQYLESSDQRGTLIRVQEKNILGWIGIAMLVFIGWSYLSWFAGRIKGK